MKKIVQSKAISLRQEGISINDIAKQLLVSQSTVSLWVRDVVLSDATKTDIVKKGRAKTSAKLSANRLARWAVFEKAACEEYETHRLNPHFMFGLALYVGEGSKTKADIAVITNCNPNVIRKSVEFFKLIGVDKTKIKFTAFIHQDVNESEARKYWHSVTGLNITNIGNFAFAASKSVDNRKFNRQPYGVGRVYVTSTEIKIKINYWMVLALK